MVLWGFIKLCYLLEKNVKVFTDKKLSKIRLKKYGVWVVKLDDNKWGSFYLYTYLILPQRKVRKTLSHIIDMPNGSFFI